MSTLWFDGVTLTVEAALSASTGTYGAWDSAVWDTSTWGPDIVWTDITRWVRSFSTSRSFDRDIVAWAPGSATVVLDNRDGRFSPDNLSSPYVTAGVTGVRPWRPLRIRATYAGTTYDLYNGYATAWNETWLPGPGTGTGDAYVTVPCLDELARLGRFDGLAVSPVGSGETTGARIHRILNNAGHTGPRSIDTGTNTVQATTLASNAVDELKLTTDSEGGSLFVDSDSTVVFERLTALMENTRSNTVQATFGDAGGSQLPYASAEMAYDGTLTKNIASFARAGGTSQLAFDNTSRSLYGDLRETRTDLVCETDPQALSLAQFYMNQFKDPEKRITSIAIKPRRNPSVLFPQVLGRRVRDLIRVVRTPPGGFTLTRDCHIAGVTHSVERGSGKWDTRFQLWSATFYQTYATSKWDVATWDGSAWFF
jgi:hypothetical protein